MEITTHVLGKVPLQRGWDDIYTVYNCRNPGMDAGMGLKGFNPGMEQAASGLHRMAACK